MEKKCLADEILRRSVEHILPHISYERDIENMNFFITGGTGFVGTWLLNVLLMLSDRRNLGLNITVLSRDPNKFAQSQPALATRVKLWQGDMIDFKYPTGRFDYVIHAATETDVRLIEARPETHFDSIVNGTRRVLDFAEQGGCRKFLYLSSGAVYGQQPPEVDKIREDYVGAPDILKPAGRHVAYGEGKRVAEMFCCMRAPASRMEVKIARLFAFVGPYLPTDEHFAIGNFMKNILDGEKIVILGDGTPYRSYMHAADMALWLLNILFEGKHCNAYNVGSDEAISIEAVANLVAHAINPPAEIEIKKKPTVGVPAARYVPSVDRAKQELALGFHFDLRESIDRTIEWHRLVGDKRGSN